MLICFEIVFLIINLTYSFPKLTEQYFDKRPWPEESDIAPLVDNDPVRASLNWRSNVGTAFLAFEGCFGCCASRDGLPSIMPSEKNNKLVKIDNNYRINKSSENSFMSKK